MKKFNCISNADEQNDLEILNNALYLEHQAIWTYTLAIGKLSNTAIGQIILDLAQENLNDHRQHQDLLVQTIQDLAGTPIQAEVSYDLSSYFNNAEGDFTGDIRIAKLALALEIDAAIAYVTEFANLSHASLIKSGVGIGCIEAIHVARLRELLKCLTTEIAVVPSALICLDNREQWVLTI